MITSGFVLRQYREIFGIKQWVMAARLGFSSAVLCDIEKGRKSLTPELKQKAEEIFEEYEKKQPIQSDRKKEIIEAPVITES